MGLFIPFSITVVMTQYYTWSKPVSAEPQHGDTVPIRVNYGRTVYVTTTEATWFHIVNVLVAIGIVSFTVYAVARVFKEKRDSGFFKEKTI